MHVVVGNATDDQSVSGLYTYALDEGSGAMELRQFVPQSHPHYVARTPSGTRIYAVSFVAASEGSPGGAVYGYAVDPVNGRLTEINHRIMPFTFPNYVQADRSEHFLFVACTSGGGVVVLPIEASGALGEPSSVHPHRGTPFVALGATEHPAVAPPDACQPHAIGADMTNRLVVVPDLAAQRLVRYRFDAESGRLDPIEPAVDFPPGTGPRHFIFHRTNGLLYVLNETASSITILSHDPETGSVDPVGTVSALPADFTGRNMSAELVLAGHGKFLYCTNRGHDSIAMFAVSDSAPYLEPLGWQSTNGTGPRGLAVAPGGRFLFATNRGSDSVVSLAIDGTSGALEIRGLVEVPAPSSVAIV